MATQHLHQNKETFATEPDEESKPDKSSKSSFRNPVLSLLGVSERKQLVKEAQKEDRDESSELILSSSSGGSDNVRDSILSTYSDSDVKQVMSKIASLEEERIKLLETVDKLHHDNQVVHLSLGEILGDLESKDLQLTLAMQDLSIATEEIKKAVESRSRLASLEREKEQLTEHLSNLEDESAAVKVSLIRLLQEKSATNKTLALENWRLTQRMRRLSVRRGSRSNAGPPSGSAQSPGADGDNDSVASGFSTITEDTGLQEAYIGFDDAGTFVHKQGFLTKQGAKVKSWKRRLFVLNTEGLSYFKTEQPIQTIPLERIDKVQVCHGRAIHPNMFEVHTQGRVFLLSAPSEDEMQSWVGMLQTLKQYNKVTAQAQAQAQAQAESADDKPSGDDSSPQMHRKVVQSEAPELEPINLPQVRQHQPLTQTSSTPLSGALATEEEDSDIALLSDEPRVMSVPTSPSNFGDANVDSPRSGSRSDIIASLNLQI